MNIFILDNDPQECAKAYQDRHLHWGVHDTASALYAAHEALDGHTPVNAYLPCDIRHAQVTWTKQSQANYEWMADLCGSLIAEYNYRMMRQHFMEEICLTLCHTIPMNIDRDATMSRHHNSVPTIFATDNLLDSNRNYYMSKHKGAVWSWPRHEPSWWSVREAV